MKEETPEDKADELYVEGKGGKQGNNKPSIIDKLKQEIAKVREAYESPNGNRSQEWLKAPNGADSNLSEDLWVFVRTPSFKKWFGDWENNPKHASKVLDENGEPMVLYHCSDEPDIAEFIVPWEGPIEWDGLPGLFFSPKPQTAYGKNVYSVFLNIRRPTDMDGKGERRAINGRSLKKLEEFGKQYEDSIKANEKEFKFLDDGSLNITDKGLDSLKSDGYYGTLAEDGTKEYAVLSPQQVMMLTKNVDGKGDGIASGKGDKTEETVDNKPLVTPEEDAAYLEAAEKGDEKTVKRLFEKAAKRYFADSKVQSKVWHNTKKKFTEFRNNFPNVFFFAKDRKWADIFGKEERYSTKENTKAYYVRLGKPLDMRGERTGNEWLKFFEDNGIKLGEKGVEKLSKVGEETLPGWAILNHDMSEPYGSGYRDSMVAAGFDGAVFEDKKRGTADRTTYGVFNSNAIKSADPVTYDDNGKVIPLSRRFDNGDDIRGDVSGKTEYIEKMKSLHPDINSEELIDRLKNLGSREEMEAEIQKILGKK